MYLLALSHRKQNRRMLVWAFWIISVLLSPTGCTNVTNGEKRDNKNAVMSIFGPIKRSPGPCRYIMANRNQTRLCRRDYGLAEAIREARKLAVHTCEEQFRYDRWNCSIETRGKRNIFKKVYRETAFVHALTAAALTYTIARSCALGNMTRCKCAPSKNPHDTRLTWRWGGCSDNVGHGRRMTRKFLELQPKDGDHVAEVLRHDSEVGIQTLMSTMINKCKCYGVSGSCSTKSCWRRMNNFNETAALLRAKYHQAVMKMPSNKASRRSVTATKVKQKKKSLPTLFYLDTSPTFCAVTRGRECQSKDNCATLCCGRGYSTHVVRVEEQCHYRFESSVSFNVVWDYCERFEDRFYCK